MRTNFDDAMTFTFAQEGGYTFDPHDSGGETLFGISRVHNPNWIGWLKVDSLKGKPGFPENVANDPELKDQAKQIYRLNYWTPIHGDEIPFQLALGVFDTAVNQGVDTAIKILQRTLKVKDDGVFGPITLAAAKMSEPRTATLFLARRLINYHEIMKAKPSDERYALNWFHRTIELARSL